MQECSLALVHRLIKLRISSNTNIVVSVCVRGYADTLHSAPTIDISEPRYIAGTVVKITSSTSNDGEKRVLSRADINMPINPDVFSERDLYKWSIEWMPSEFADRYSHNRHGVRVKSQGCQANTVNTVINMRFTAFFSQCTIYERVTARKVSITVLAVNLI